MPADIAHVFIHDCARPLVRPEQLVALHKIVRREHAVVLAVPADAAARGALQPRGGAGQRRLASSVLAEKRTVCTITVNSADEKEMFRSRLPAGDYRVEARALASDPMLLLLDEPTAGMNPHEIGRAHV